MAMLSLRVGRAVSAVALTAKTARMCLCRQWLQWLWLWVCHFLSPEDDVHDVDWCPLMLMLILMSILMLMLMLCVCLYLNSLWPPSPTSRDLWNEVLWREIATARRTSLSSPASSASCPAWYRSTHTRWDVLKSVEIYYITCTPVYFSIVIFVSVLTELAQQYLRH